MQNVGMAVVKKNPFIHCSDDKECGMNVSLILQMTTDTTKNLYGKWKLDTTGRQTFPSQWRNEPSSFPHLDELVPEHLGEGLHVLPAVLAARAGPGLPVLVLQAPDPPVPVGVDPPVVQAHPGGEPGGLEHVDGEHADGAGHAEGLQSGEDL